MQGAPSKYYLCHIIPEFHSSATELGSPHFFRGMQMRIGLDYNVGSKWLEENLIDFSEQST